MDPMSNDTELQPRLYGIFEHPDDPNGDIITENDLVALGWGISAGFLITSFLMILMAGKISTYGKTSIDKELTSQVNEVLRSAGLEHDYTVYVSDMGDIKNAYVFAGKNVFITKALREMLTQRELIAVMMHEVSHLRSHDVWKRALVTAPLSLAVLNVLTHSNVALPLVLAVFYSMVYIISPILYDIFMSKKREAAADKFAVEMGYGKDLISALNKLAEANKKMAKAVQTQCGGFCQLVRKLNNIMNSHPTVAQRVEDVLKHMDEIQKASKRGFSAVAAAVMKYGKISVPKLPPDKMASLEKMIAKFSRA